jgi:segregation and condensation protein B
MNEEPELMPEHEPLAGDAAVNESLPAVVADADTTEEAGATETSPEVHEDVNLLAGAMEALAENHPSGEGQPGAEDPSEDDAEGPSTADAEGSVEAGPVKIDHELTTEQVVEAILFAADTPLPLSKIVSLIGVGSARDVRKHINALNDRYDERGAAFRIEVIAGGYQMLTRPEFNTWLRRLKQNRQDSRLSQAAMETLAVVAYKQPVVRADIEAIRGVASGEMLNRLRELGLIKIVGRAEDLGRPMLYGTTKRFLEVFGLSGLEDLPEVEELKTDEE